MKITMDGQYAYRKDPYTQVRILCVDRPDITYPTLSMSGEGGIQFHTPTGVAPYYPDYDLVPLQEKLPDLWVNVFPDGGWATFKSKERAEKGLKNAYGEFYTPYKGVKTIKYVPAPDQTS